MKYYQNPKTKEVFGYDETYVNDEPLIQEAIANGWDDLTGSWPPAPVPYIPTAEDNSNTAQSLLSSTDWTTLPDVALETNSTYLTNQAEFIAYRNEVRNLGVNGGAGNLTWPTIPTAKWSN
jgi:hypothetical protein